MGQRQQKVKTEMTARNANSDPPMTIRTLYEMFRELDAKMDKHSELLAVMAHQLSQPMPSCPRNADLLDVLKRFDKLVSTVENHERRLTNAERVVAIIVALGGIAVAVAGKLLYDLFSGAAQLTWH